MGIGVYVLVVISGYLLGCSNMAFYLSKLRGIDLRKAGSGNLGTSNALILMGWKAGILTVLHDGGKAVVAVAVARALFPEVPLVGVVAGVSCVLGHIFPFYLRFRGGKGFASYLGMTIALNWKFALVVLVLVGVITLITDYIVIATVSTVVGVPIFFGIADKSVLFATVLALASFVILYKHRENYVRIWNGTEIGFRRANRGDDRKRSETVQQ